jgi:hypothetical protein
MKKRSIALAGLVLGACTIPQPIDPPGGGGGNPPPTTSAPTTTAPAPAPSAAPRLGTNLSGTDDWNTEIQFADLFKISRPWTSGSATEWDDKRPFDLDERGWIRSLAPGQVARTLLFSDHTHFRPGVYDLTYNGIGKLEISRPTTEVAPGHLTIDLSDNTTPTLFITLVETDPANPIRDIKITAPGGTCIDKPTVYALDASGCADGQYLPFLGNTERILFNPDFLARTEGYQALRYMDFMRTNNSTLSAWADRPEVADARWNVNGVPMEVLVELSNRTNAHPWFTMPHLADDDFMRNAAALVRDRLEPGLIAYVEFSNEVWNSQFEQHKWAGDRGMALGLDPTPWGAAWLYYAQRSTEMHKIWAEVFGGRERLHMVTASQAGNSYVAEQIMGFGDTAAWTDSLAVAPYFGEVPNTEERGNELRAMTPSQFLDHAETVLLPEAIGHMRDNKAVADRFGVVLTAYEGGQHNVAGPVLHNYPEIVKLFDDVNRDPRMGALYTQYLNAWEATGGGLFEHFVNVSAWSKWGYWGALEHVQQTSSPKYDALMAYLSRGARATVDPLPPA